MTTVDPRRVAQLGDVIRHYGGQWTTGRAVAAAKSFGWRPPRSHVRTALHALADQGQLTACEARGRRYYVPAQQNQEAGR